MRYFIQVRNQAIIRILKAFSPRSAITFYPLDQFWRILGLYNILTSTTSDPYRLNFQDLNVLMTQSTLLINLVYC